MKEATTGKVEIDDFEAVTVETMVYFMYNDNILDEKMINADLLRLAEKYNVKSLVDICVKHLEKNLSMENALDVLVISHLINQKDLFESATNFFFESRGYLVETDFWKELMKTNQKLVNDVFEYLFKTEGILEVSRRAPNKRARSKK